MNINWIKGAPIQTTKNLCALTRSFHMKINYYFLVLWITRSRDDLRASHPQMCHSYKKVDQMKVLMLESKKFRLRQSSRKERRTFMNY